MNFKIKANPKVKLTKVERDAIKARTFELMGANYKVKRAGSMAIPVARTVEFIKKLPALSCSDSYKPRPHKANARDLKQVRQALLIGLGLNKAELRFE